MSQCHHILTPTPRRIRPSVCVGTGCSSVHAHIRQRVAAAGAQSRVRVPIQERHGFACGHDVLLLCYTVEITICTSTWTSDVPYTACDVRIYTCKIFGKARLLLMMDGLAQG